GYENPTYKFF
nr:Chain C, PEPTIDE1AQC_D Chain D, PEPTIDE